ncbi:MAG: hypothetical protein KGI84_09050, partial [Elusimicrobia bacterium]|nr:hypothetical protein [Elusimicrobiota bacterium]
MPMRGPVRESELWLKERFLRVKHAGGALDGLLFRIANKTRIRDEGIAESFLGCEPLRGELEWDKVMPYFANLERLGLGLFSRRYNPHIRFFPHHYCHARAAAALSPFSRSLIVVNDEAGNLWGDVPREFRGAALAPPPEPPSAAREFYTVYRQVGARLQCVEKKWQLKRGPANGSVGRLYSAAAQYIFNSYWSHGKVMGLAAFGRPGKPAASAREVLREKFAADKRFQGRGKKEWESCGRIGHYADAAAAVQEYFERWLAERIADLKRRFPREENLILTGGCALNCVANMKLARQGLFSSVYVPPFPGDESIAFGAACGLRYGDSTSPWKPLSWDEQVPNFGPKESEPDDKSCRAAFAGWKARRVADPGAAAADLLRRHKVVGWFQGRSESGPRALGFRSILANPLQAGIKDYLNGRIKGRESFRPYGCSVLWEDAGRYFCVPKGFESPFMSFAPHVREEWREKLGEITHKD